MSGENLTGAPGTRSVDQYGASPVEALIAVGDALDELRVVEQERDNALLEVDRLKGEVERLNGLLAARSDEDRNEVLRKAHARKGLRR